MRGLAAHLQRFFGAARLRLAGRPRLTAREAARFARGKGRLASLVGLRLPSRERSGWPPAGRSRAAYALLIRYSSTGPRRAAFLLIARRAGTRWARRPARRASMLFS